MSYDIYLNEKEESIGYSGTKYHEVLKMPHLHYEGGTINLCGEEKCILNVTYNYCNLFRFKSLDGKVAKDTLKEMKDFCEEHKGEPIDLDYWKSCPGNVRKALEVLIRFSEQHPEGIWEVI